MTRDILTELAHGKISANEAERIYDDVMDNGSGDFAEELGLSRVEATAFVHGVGLVELSRWRSEGWPDICAACSRKIEIPKFGWIAKAKRHGTHYLKHLECPRAD